MNPIIKTVTAAALAVTGLTAQAQFVKGNEAVTRLPGGKVRVETPPLPKISLYAPCPATNNACVASAWLMVETSEGLQECTEFYARPGSCRASSFGKKKLHRLWVVKLNGRWMQCDRPDVNGRCVSTGALPPVVTAH